MVSVRAVYHEGQLRLLDPVSLKEGQQVHLQILLEDGDLSPTAQNLSQAERIMAVINARDSELEDVSEEWWDEFQQFLKDNRFNIPEQDLGFDEE